MRNNGGDLDALDNSGLPEGERRVWRLLGRLSHEMRTPLGAILGFAQLMESARPAPTAAQKRSLNLIIESGWRLEKLISMTRDLARLESGTLSVCLEPVPLSEMLLDCRGSIEAQARTRGVRVIFSALDSPLLVWADPVCLRQAVSHWLSAAIEDMATNGLIVVDCETQEAGASGVRWTRFSIEGPAVRREPPADERIGLLLAKRLIQLMQGSIGAEACSESGSLFSFELLQAPLAADLRPQRIVHLSDNHSDAATGYMK